MLIPKNPLRLGGIASGLNVGGIGNVKWTFLADYGRFITLNLCAYFVLACKQQFLSPQKTFSKDQGVTGSFVISEDYARLLIKDSPVLTIPYDPVNELSNSRAIRSEFDDSHSASLNLCVTEASNQNLSEAQKELLRWHFRFGHFSAASIQWLLRQPSFGTSLVLRAAANCTPPKCAACEYGKAHRNPVKAVISTPLPEREGAVKSGDLFPGSRVSVDHFESRVPGHLYTSHGKSHTPEKYKGGCIFVDHASGLLYVHHRLVFLHKKLLLLKCILKIGPTIRVF